MKILNGNIYSHDIRILNINKAKEELNSLKEEEVIVKPEAGEGGGGVFFIKASKINLADLHHKGDIIIQKSLEQNHILSDFYPYSLNTIRVLTIIDKEEIPQIVGNYLKFGIGRSRVDNSSDGGGLWLY